MLIDLDPALARSGHRRESADDHEADAVHADGEFQQRLARRADGHDAVEPVLFQAVDQVERLVDGDGRDLPEARADHA